MNKRICYFGTRGKPGHFAYPIVGNFSKKELDNISKIDHPVYHEAMKADGFIYGSLENFMFYAIPHSMDDKRSGCISAIFVEFATSSKDIREAIMSDCELRLRFGKRYPKENEINPQFDIDRTLRIHEQKWSNTHRWIISTEEASIQLEIYPEPRGEDKIKAYIWALWVAPSARKKGIATELLSKAEEIAKAQGEPFVWLEWDDADSDRFVLEWYQRNGYEEVAFGTHNVLLRKALTSEQK